jgi:hypothetical protein
MQLCNGICGSILLPEISDVAYSSRWVWNSLDIQEVLVTFAIEVIRLKYMFESKIRLDSKLPFRYYELQYVIGY